jgi:hypothetical protein
MWFINHGKGLAKVHFTRAAHERRPSLLAMAFSLIV